MANNDKIKKADDWMRSSYLQRQIDIAQQRTGRKGVDTTFFDKPEKKKKEQPKKQKVEPKPGVQTPAPKKERPVAPKTEFPISKDGVQLKPGDSVTYVNRKGVEKSAKVNAMLKTKDKQGDLQIQLKLGTATYAVDRQNIRSVNGDPWEFDPNTQKGKVKENLLKEGGNVFKDKDKNPLTTRIATPKVRPTVAAIEKIVDLEFVDDDLLGTTGKKVDPDGSFELNSSGDLDLNTDIRKISKEELIAKLTAWCKKQGIPEEEIERKPDGWIRNAGDQVHFRMPIVGYDGYVQVDFMLTDDPDYQRGAKRGGTKNYTGADRAILLSSLARGRGYKMSPKFGLVDPNNGDSVVTKDWNEIAKILLGDPNAKESDTHTVEGMIAILKKDPNFEELIAPWKETMEKQGKSVPTESLADKQLNRIKELMGNM